MTPLWEYRVEEIEYQVRMTARRTAAEGASLAERLNAVGAEGWELVGVERLTEGASTGRHYLVAVFKRPKT